MYTDVEVDLIMSLADNKTWHGEIHHCECSPTIAIYIFSIKRTNCSFVEVDNYQILIVVSFENKDFLSLIQTCCCYILYIKSKSCYKILSKSLFLLFGKHCLKGFRVHTSISWQYDTILSMSWVSSGYVSGKHVQ